MEIVITGAILWAASKIAPDAVRIDDFKTLVIATVLLIAIELTIYLLCAGAILFGFFAWNPAIIVLSIILALFPCYFALGLLSYNLDGFYVADPWARIILAIIMSSCTARRTSTSHSQ